MDRSLNAADFSTMRQLLATILCLLLSSCAQHSTPTEPAGNVQPPSPPAITAPAASEPSQPAYGAAAPSAVAPVAAIPFDDAVTNAANALFSQAKLPASGDAVAKQLVVIDPLIDGVSGAQSKATRSMEARIVEIARAKYPQFAIQPFTAANVKKSPVVLVGTFTPINSQGQTTGTREAYRVCLVLADLQSGKVVGKGTARAQLQGVDHGPTPYFQDSPAWMSENATEGYINTCQASKVGDAIQPAYLDGIMAATLISEAITYYETGKYRDALERYNSALELPAGNQLRVLNGLYLTSLKLGRQAAADAAFGKIVDHGLANNRLAVKFLFRPGTTGFITDRQLSAPYPFWLKEIAKRAAQKHSCLEIIGHTSPTGPEPLNERLSLLRAEVIKKNLEDLAPSLNGRTIATGKGSRENLIGTGKDDLSDSLDRRVVFSVIACA